MLHHTLSGDPEVEDYQRNLTARTCQDSCLVYFSVAFLDYAEEPDKEQLFLRGIEDMTQTELRWEFSPEHLTMRLVLGVTGEDADTESFRARKVMRLMLDVKELDDEARAMVRQRLWRFVSLSC